LVGISEAYANFLFSESPNVLLTDNAFKSRFQRTRGRVKRESSFGSALKTVLKKKGRGTQSERRKEKFSGSPKDGSGLRHH